MQKLNDLLALEYNEKDEMFERHGMIEQPIKEIIREINTNPNILSYSSTKMKGVDGNTSYLYIFYSENVEQRIKRNLIPSFEAKFNIEDTPGLLGCKGGQFTSTIDNDLAPDKNLRGRAYFSLRLKSENPDLHEQFWEEIRVKLTMLKA